MMGEVLGCPKCKGSMEEGFIPDRIADVGGAKVSEWYEGPPKWSFWTGVKTKGIEHYSVRTYRCTGCGYLEFYAR